VRAWYDQNKRLELRVADLVNHGGGFHRAFQECDIVLHMASPFWSKERVDNSKPFELEDGLIKPAVEGTINVLRAALKQKVRRVVMTSSCAAVVPQAPREPGEERVYHGPEHWQEDSTLENGGAYRRSKSEAERAAWAFVEGTDLELVAINPAFVLGPAVHARASGVSIQFMKRLLEGAFVGKPSPRKSYGVVDVRDVAEAHIRAMDHPDAAGERFIMSSHHSYSRKELRDILVAAIDGGDKAEGYDPGAIPVARLPRWLLHELPRAEHGLPQHYRGILFHQFGSNLRRSFPHYDTFKLGGKPKAGMGGLHELEEHERTFYNRARAEAILGLRLRPIGESLLEMASSLNKMDVAGDASEYGRRTDDLELLKSKGLRMAFIDMNTNAEL
jgi:nucleoside-diphosphate-sugar epimerase